MMGSTLIEQKAAGCFCFLPSKQDCFGLKGPCQHQGNVNEQSVTLGWLPSVGTLLASVFQCRIIAFRWMNIEKVVLSGRTDHLISAAV